MLSDSTGHRVDDPSRGPTYEPPEEGVPSIWEDENVKQALANGRGPGDISLLSCPDCGVLSYYNQGSHFTCRACEGGWFIATEDEDPPVDQPYILAPELLTLDDQIEADCEDAPN